MIDSLLIKIFFSFIALLLIVCPFALQAIEIQSPLQEIEPTEIVEDTKQMTQSQMNELFGEDPYLGQTSYLQSPDSFSQAEKSK